MWYINYQTKGQPTETLDEFDNHAEAMRTLWDYQLAFTENCKLWISTRATKTWREDEVQKK